MAAGEAFWGCKAGAFRCSTSACRGGGGWSGQAAAVEAAARGLEPLKRRQLRSLQEKLSGPAWRVLRCCTSA